MYLCVCSKHFRMLKERTEQDLLSSSTSLIAQRMVQKTRKQSVMRLIKANKAKENGKDWKNWQDLKTSETRDDEKIYEFLVAKFEKRMVLIASIYRYLLGPDFSYHVGIMGPAIDVRRFQSLLVYRLFSGICNVPANI